MASVDLWFVEVLLEVVKVLVAELSTIEFHGAHSVAQWIMPPLARLATHKRVLVQVQATMLLTRLRANTPRKVAEDGSVTCVPATYAGVQDGVYGSWLLLGYCRHLVDTFNLSLSFSLSPPLSPPSLSVSLSLPVGMLFK